MKIRPWWLSSQQAMIVFFPCVSLWILMVWLGKGPFFVAVTISMSLVYLLLIARCLRTSIEIGETTIAWQDFWTKESASWSSVQEVYLDAPGVFRPFPSHTVQYFDVVALRLTDGTTHLLYGSGQLRRAQRDRLVALLKELAHAHGAQFEVPFGRPLSALQGPAVAHE